MLPTQNPTVAPVLASPALPPGIERSVADKVLGFYLADQGTTVVEIASHCQVAIRTIGLIIESDYGREIIALVKRLAQERAEVVALEVRTEAIYATRRIALNTTRIESARLAAACLLRLQPARHALRPADDDAEAHREPKTESSEPRAARRLSRAGRTEHRGRVVAESPAVSKEVPAAEPKPALQTASTHNQPRSAAVAAEPTPPGLPSLTPVAAAPAPVPGPRVPEVSPKADNARIPPARADPLTNGHHRPAA